MGFVDIASPLLLKDANLDIVLYSSSRNMSFLQLAMREGHVEIMKLRLRRGAESVQKDLEDAICRRQMAAVYLLLDHDCPIVQAHWGIATQQAQHREDYAYSLALIQHGGDYQHAAKNAILVPPRAHSKRCQTCWEGYQLLYSAVKLSDCLFIIIHIDCCPCSHRLK
jgi:hypothetical protein